MSSVGSYNKEKKDFTAKRNRQLLTEGHPPFTSPRQAEEIEKNILRLERQYGHYCLVPLDLPRIDISEEFREWFFEEAKPATKLKPDVATGSYNVSSFLSIDVLPDTKTPADIKPQTSIWSKNYYDYFDKMWPEVYEQLHDLLPLTKLSFSMWSSTMNIMPHRDEALFCDIPGEFRVLADSNPEPNLFVSEVLPDHSISEKIQTTAVPTNLETNVFSWNNLRCKHHSTFHSNYKKIIFIFNGHLAIDWKKYETILERSVDKYKDRCMISKNDISDYVYL